MKIGLILYGSLNAISGGYLYDRQLVNFLKSQGDSVEIISLPWRNYAAHLTDNLSFNLPQDLDVLIQDELNHPSLIGANLRTRRVPVISLVHHLRCLESRPSWQNALYRVVEGIYLRSVDGFIFNSETTQGAVRKLAGYSTPGIIAHPPVDRFGETIPEEQIKKRANRKPFHILFLGNVMERKGLHTLLEAMRYLPPGLHLDVIGSMIFQPKYARKMRRLVEEYSLSAQVTFYSTLVEHELMEKLRQAHVLVVPSTYEGFGIVYLEGMCFGLPAIGTTAGAAGEIIDHKRTGFLIEPDDHDSLASYLELLAGNRGLLTRMSLNARQRYLQEPAWGQTAASIRDFLLGMAE